MPHTDFAKALPATLGSILDIVADAVITVDVEQRVVFFNRGAERIFGWSATEIVGQSLHELLPLKLIGVHDRHIRSFADGLENARLMGERAEVFARRKNGDEFPAEVSIARLAEGEQVYFTAILRDVTERKRQEAALSASREQLRALSRRHVEALEEERRSIARELHDEAGQSLTALQFGLNALEKELATVPAGLARVEEMKRQINVIQVGLHRLAVRLRPASLDKLGLIAALQQYARSFEDQSGLTVKFVAMGLEGHRLPAEAETALYRITQEALTNVARHAHASAAGIMLERKENSLLLIVEDNGDGFDPDEGVRQNSLGLAGIRERAEALGGSLTVESHAGQGATLFVTLPMLEVPVDAFSDNA